MPRNTRSNAGRRSPEAQALTDLILIIFKTNVELVDAGPLISRSPTLNAMRWLILRTLSESSKTAAELGREIGLSRQGALLNVKVLTDLGYVVLEDNADDARAKKVALTEEGLDKLLEINRYAGLWLNQLATHFDKAQIDIAIEVVDKLRMLVPTSVSIAR